MLPVVPSDRLNGSVDPIAIKVDKDVRLKPKDPGKILLGKFRVEAPSGGLRKSLIQLGQRQVRHGHQKTNETSERGLGNVERC